MDCILFKICFLFIFYFKRVNVEFFRFKEEVIGVNDLKEFKVC